MGPNESMDDLEKPNKIERGKIMNDIMFLANLIKRVDLSEQMIGTLHESMESSFKYLIKANKLICAASIIIGTVGIIHTKQLSDAQRKIKELDKRIAALEYANCDTSNKEEHNTEFDFLN